MNYSRRQIVRLIAGGAAVPAAYQPARAEDYPSRPVRGILGHTTGIGTTPHLAGELFKMMTGIDLQHIPYRGAAPALTDLIAGQVQLYFSTTPASIEYIRSGRLRGLAVTTAERLDALPELPTIGE